MKRISLVTTLALSLIIALTAQPVLLAQVANPTNGHYQGSGKYEKQIRLFDEFAENRWRSTKRWE